MLPLSASGQTKTPHLAITSPNGATGVSYTPPKTPWGDPDMQGTRTWRQTSLLVDPPDGRYPAFTPAAETRRASRDRGTFGDGPFENFEDFTLYDRCITRGIVGGVLPVPGLAPDETSWLRRS